MEDHTIDYDETLEEQLNSLDAHIYDLRQQLVKLDNVRNKSNGTQLIALNHRREIIVNTIDEVTSYRGKLFNLYLSKY